ncbi:MAG: hypothetical protein BWY66_01701 [bacterium ADurb.Bin374]|nr:MAG: hypothetical protein BWY66_01701 [bacterium ADurb.Bin374]
MESVAAGYRDAHVLHGAELEHALLIVTGDDDVGNVDERLREGKIVLTPGCDLGCRYAVDFPAFRLLEHVVPGGASDDL